jgi:hypothetical protein
MATPAHALQDLPTGFCNAPYYLAMVDISTGGMYAQHWSDTGATMGFWLPQRGGCSGWEFGRAATASTDKGMGQCSAQRLPLPIKTGTHMIEGIEVVQAVLMQVYHAASCFPQPATAAQHELLYCSPERSYMVEGATLKPTQRMLNFVASQRIKHLCPGLG